MAEPFLFSYGDSIALKSSNAYCFASDNSTDRGVGTQNGIEQNIPVWTIDHS